MLQVSQVPNHNPQLQLHHSRNRSPHQDRNGTLARRRAVTPASPGDRAVLEKKTGDVVDVTVIDRRMGAPRTWWLVW